MGYTDTWNKMANKYCIQCLARKWTKKLPFKLLDLTVLNSLLLLTSCGARNPQNNSNLPSCRTWLQTLGIYLTYSDTWADHTGFGKTGWGKLQQSLASLILQAELLQ
jgi:hypothetical protein